MKKLLTTAAIALGLAGAMLATVEPAAARDRTNVDINIGFGEVAYGYRDGYWDHQRQWHHWRHHRDSQRFREQRRNDYHGWDHGRDRDQGWHDRDGGDRHR